MTLSRVTFDEAIAETEGKRRHILLGNGFSISGFSGFRYERLAERACGVDIDPSMRVIFSKYETTDFEVAMGRAENHEIRGRIRSAFIDTITTTHPYRNALDREQRLACAEFLGKFLRGADDKSLRGRIFTTNYDLMLYWVLVEFKKKLDCSDGFDAQNYWNPIRVGRSGNAPRVFYLHGGLHLYKVPGRKPTSKITSTVNFMTLVDRIRDKVRSDQFPIIVTEKSYNEKLQIIESDEDYLKPVLQMFQNTCATPNDVLFTYGHSLSPIDHHLSLAIARGRMGAVYIGVFSDDGVPRIETLESKWSKVRAQKGLPPIHVKIYASRDVPVWRSA